MFSFVIILLQLKVFVKSNMFQNSNYRFCITPLELAPSLDKLDKRSGSYSKHYGAQSFKFIQNSFTYLQWSSCLKRYLLIYGGVQPP